MGRTRCRDGVVGRHGGDLPTPSGRQRRRSGRDRRGRDLGHRALPSAGGRRGAGAAQGHSLRCRYPRQRRDRRVEPPDRRSHDPVALRQRADLAGGGAEDPVAAPERPRALGEDRAADDIDHLDHLPADWGKRDRPLHRRQLRPALRHRAAGLVRRPRAGAVPGRDAAAAGLVDRDRRPRDRRGGAGNRPGRGHAGDRGHDRRRRRGGQRRCPRARRHDADVRLDDLRDPGGRPSA